MMMNTKSSKTYSDVWVINRMAKDYTEKYQGDPLTIKAGDKIKMSRNDASMFLGQFPGASVEKNFEVEPIFDEADQKQVYVSQIDGKEFDTIDKLNEHLDKLRKAIVSKK